MNTYIESFLAYFSTHPEHRLSKNTLENYQRDIRQFFSFIKKDVTEIVQSDIDSYIAFLKNYRKPMDYKPYSIRTVNRKIIAVNQFFKYLREHENISSAVFFRQEKIQFQQFKEETLTKKDVRRIVTAIKKADDIRALALVSTLFYTGMRISEVLQMKTYDVGERLIWIQGKGEKHRQVFLPKALLPILKNYLDCRYKSDSEFLFVGQKGPMTRQFAGKIVKHYTGMAKVKKSKVYPHAFRHLYSRLLLEAGVSYVEIKQLMGHSLSVTENYMSFGPNELLKKVDKIRL
jgi:integrase/recombinase XerD